MPAQAKRLQKKAAANRRIMPPLDWPMAIIVLTLLVFGLVMLFSASYATGYYRFNDSFVFIRQQLLFAGVGVVAMFAASFFDYHILHRFAWPIMGVTLLLLVIVLFMQPLNNARRWIFLPFGGTLQPSEVAKFAVIVTFAHMLSVNSEKLKTFAYGVAPFLMVLGVIAGLMILEPHFSGLLLICAIGAVMMFIGGTGLVWFGSAVGMLGAAVAGVVLLAQDKVAYIWERLEYWRDPFSDALGKGHQTIQSLYAIGSGGLFGLGIGNSRQKHLYLPEPQNDFIFSVLCEELGFIGAMLVIILFVCLLLRGLYLASKARDKFGAMLIVGIVVQITLQALLNIAVVTNTIPNTGISLPFFSYGGTSLTMLLGEIGIVLSVSRQCNLEKV